MRYLVKITPLEPYSFGNDQNFTYSGEEATGKESYFVRSKEVPEQTSILGLLRYLILQKRGLLRTDFKYTPEERGEMQIHIGERSFSYLAKEKQSFGDIHDISPVFLVNEKEEVFIRNPYHNRAMENGYEPMEMQDGIETSNGTIAIPKENQYDAKNGYATGYINLNTLDIVHDIFESQIVVGNSKSDMPETDDGGFFKRELKYMKEGFSFGVYVNAAEEAFPSETIGYMGKKKSAFRIEAAPVVEGVKSLEEQIKDSFSDSDGMWYYAASDIVLSQPMTWEDFCIVEEKYQRNLETIFDSKSSTARIKKSQVRHNLIQAGSVFYRTCDSLLQQAQMQENCQQIGYNRIVKLGGH